MGCQEVELPARADEVPLKAEVVTKKKKNRRRRGSRRNLGGTVRKNDASETEAQDRKLLRMVEASEVSLFGMYAFIHRFQGALRNIPTKLPPAVSATKRVKRVSWKDEETGGGGVCSDPAVLAIGPARKPLQYTREQLLSFKNSPHAKLYPDIQHEAFITIRKRTDSPNDDDRGARGDAPNDNHKGIARDRRPADPRERVRKESEPSGGGIVLSPQRRSFTSGCGAPTGPGAAAPPTLARTRPESPLPSKSDPVRRIGSGRIITRDITTVPWERGANNNGDDAAATERDSSERPDPLERPERPERKERYVPTQQPYRPPNAPRDRGDDRFERRSFGRDSFGTDMKRDRDDRYIDKRDRDDNRRMNRFGGQRGRYDKDSEPEWFSAGPTSQLDTIELRGFEEPASTKTKTINGNVKDAEKRGSGSKSPVATNDRWREKPTPQNSSSPPPTHSSPQPQSEDDQANNDKDSGVELKGDEQRPSKEPLEFNLDDFLKSDSIPDFTNGTSEVEGGSRFSRWFRHERDSPDQERRLFNNIMDDLEGSNPEPPHLFAPISPAGGCGAPPPPPHQQPPLSLLEMLQRANAASGPQRHQPHEEINTGKMQSLEELEARLRGARPPQQHAPPPPQPRTPTHHHDNDVTAFKRLLAQVSGGHPVHTNNEPHHKPQQAPPMSLMEMLNKSVEQQHKQQQQHQQQQQQQPHIPQELVYKLLQVQQQSQQQQQQQQQQQHHQNHQPEMPGSVPEHELLARPEASAIIRGLKHGEITSQHLIQQLSNPGLQSRHREMLLSILRQHNMQQQQQQQHHQMGGSPMPGGGAAHLMVPPHHQPLRLSPLPHTAYCVSPIMSTSPNTLTVHHPGAPPPHMLSPRELAVRAQSIMQSALIKKKLEEAKENYKRRHEQPKQSTPISFTPTSVLRQMTADKEADSMNGKQQWAMPQKMPQGRPIVKGNHGGGGHMGQPPSNIYSNPDYPSPPHYLNHPQMGGMHQFPQRQPQAQQMNRGGNTTLHQLLVQSHQRGMTMQQLEMGGIGGDATSNQLARWFSPELLAQASAGKLPSVHVPNALSLEDLERNHHSATVRN